MKKIIYLVLFSIASLMTISSCTEEEVSPTYDASFSGKPQDPIKK